MNWTDTPLCKIAQKYHTDKCRFHNFTPYYHKLLADKPVKRVLEIGLGWAGLMHNDYPSGGSLFMWRDFFPQAEIFGLDIRPDALVNQDRIKSFLCDQSNEDSLRNIVKKIGGNFDLIVDDGSHVPAHQVLTANVFYPLLAPGGLYFIEDVHTTTGRIYDGLNELEYVQANLGIPHEVIDVQNEALADDRLILMRAPEERTRRAVVNVATNEYYRKGQDRLAKSFREIDPMAELKLYHDMPEGCPKHADRPYAFKAFAMREASRGCDVVLWCDALILPIRPMEPFWQQVERDGYFLVQGAESNYPWTAESAYQELFPGMSLAAARELNKKIPQIVGGIIAVDFRSRIGSDFFEEYFRLASSTTAFCGPWANTNCQTKPNYGPTSSYTTGPCGEADVIGHRHDQSAASVIAWNLRMKLSQYPVPYAYTIPSEGTILLHDGPGLSISDAPPSAREAEMKLAGGCPKCGNHAIGSGGGMKNCNQCGNRW